MKTKFDTVLDILAKIVVSIIGFVSLIGILFLIYYFWILFLSFCFVLLIFWAFNRTFPKALDTFFDRICNTDYN